MANIPGIIGYVVPAGFSQVLTRSGAVSLPGNPTVVALIGEGRKEEILVARALGSGQDGLNRDFLTTGAPDGRHFKITGFPVVSGTFELFLNPTGLADVPLVRLNDLQDVLRAAPLPVTTGTLGNIAAGGTQFTDSSKNFITLGVQRGDVVVILSGSMTGSKFEVRQIVNATTLAFATASSSVITNESYRIDRIIDNAGDGSPDDGQFWNNEFANYITIGLRTASTASETVNKYTIVGDGATTGAQVVSSQLITNAAGVDFTTGAGGADLTIANNIPAVGDSVSISGQVFKVVNVVSATTLDINSPLGYTTLANQSFTIDHLDPAGVVVTDGTAKVSNTDVTITTVDGITAVTVPASSNVVYLKTNGTIEAAVTQPVDTLLLAIIRTTVNTDGVVVSVDVLSQTALASAATVSAAQLAAGVDGYKGLSDGSVWNDGYSQEFFVSPSGRRFGLPSLLQGSTEPQHYIFDETTGEVVLDRALSFRDRLVVSYIPIANLNSPELFQQPIDLYTKHGYPSESNTLATAAQLAFANGASLVMAVQGGLKLQNSRYIRDIGMSEALAALEKEDLVDIVVPIEVTDIEEEVLIAFYNPSEMINSSAGVMTVGDATVGGTILMEDNSADYDVPGLNVTPLELDPDDNSLPLRLDVFRNGRLMQYSVDYTVPNLGGGIYNHPVFGNSVNTAIILTSPLLVGEKITASYRPKRAVIDLVATTQQATKLHVEQMSSTLQRKERIMMTGAPDFADKNFLLDAITGVEANFSDSKRVLYWYPNTATMVINNQSMTVDGQYIAAAAAGRMAGLAGVQIPLTRKDLVGFTLAPSTRLSVTEQNLLGGAGASLVQPLAAGGRIIVGRTTINTGNAVEEEPSIVRIGDRVAKVTRTLLEDRFVGGLVSPQVISDIESTVTSILQSFVTQGLLTNYRNVTVTQDAQEPRQVNVTFDAAPVFPLNWIFISLTVGLI